MMISDDFKDFIELLNTHGVLYMVVGGMAMNFHGYPRYTGDLDIWIKPEKENAEKMLAVVNDFGFSSVGFKVEDFCEENFVTQLGYPPLRIDILNSISGVEFDEAYQNIKFYYEDDLKINLININDLIKNKKETGRHIDLNDVERLNKLKDKK